MNTQAQAQAQTTAEANHKFLSDQSPDIASSGTDVGSVATTTDKIKLTPFTDSVEANKQLEKLGETCGDFKSYNSQLPLAEIAGTRIVKCLYQVSSKTGKRTQENSYVRIPTKHLTEEHIVKRVVELAPYVLNWLQDIESKQIKKLHSEGLLQVHTEYLSLDKLIEELEASSESARLTKGKN